MPTTRRERGWKRCINWRDLASDKPPVDTNEVLGGGTWDAKSRCSATASATKVERRKEARHRPASSRTGAARYLSRQEAIWLIQQLNDSPWLRGLTTAITPFATLTWSSLSRRPATQRVIAVKDAVEQNSRSALNFPGLAGTIDFVTLLKGAECRGLSRRHLVRGQRHGLRQKPSYQPLRPRETCYENLAAAFGKADVARA